MVPPYQVWTGSGSSWRRRSPPEEKVSKAPRLPLVPFVHLLEAPSAAIWVVSFRVFWGLMIP